jgi:DNA-damage-inducible protein D
LLGSPPDDEGSPFDQIRRTRPDGSEYWSARELMAPLGYDRWENFAEVIDKAKKSMSITQPSKMDGAFVQVTQLRDAGNLGKKERVDYELSRMACYFVAMNGDVRKDEIAAAQAYFVIMTREAEVKRELTRKEILIMALEAEERAERAEAHLVLADRKRELDAPKVREYDNFLGTEGSLTIPEFGKTRGMPGPKLILAALTQIGMLRTDNGLPMQTHVRAKRLYVDVHGSVRITHVGQVWARARLLPPSGQGHL